MLQLQLLCCSSCLDISIQVCCSRISTAVLWHIAISCWPTTQLGAHYDFLILLYSPSMHEAARGQPDFLLCRCACFIFMKVSCKSSSQKQILCSKRRQHFQFLPCVLWSHFHRLCMKTRAGLGIRNKNETRPDLFSFSFFQAGISLQKQTCLILPSVSYFWLCPCLFFAPVWWWSLSC